MGLEDDWRKWVVLALLLIGLTGVAYCLGYTISGTEESILNTLARAQAAIFAIVFSVLILGVRLSASSYSPRLASAFSSDPAYKWAVGIFAISIGFDVAVLYLIDLVSDFRLTIFVHTAFFLAIGSFWTMYEFVNETLEKTTPEGILDQISDNLAPEHIISESEASAEDPTNRDPFLTLISVIRSSIEQSDRVSAKIGLDILADRINDLLETGSEEVFREESPVDKSLENVCVDQLSHIVEDAVDEDLTQTAIEVTNTAESIGETAIEEEVERPLEHVLEGQTDLVNLLGFAQSEERVRRDAIDTSRGLISDSIDAELWYPAAVGTRRLGWRSAASVMKRGGDQRQDERYTTLLINGFPKYLRDLLQSDKELTEYQTTAWHYRSLEDVDPADLLSWACYKSMTELTSAAVRYEIKTERPFLNWKHATHGWVEGFEELYESDLETLTRIWMGTVLYLDYLESETGPVVLNDVDPHRLYMKDYGFTVDTIDSILDGDIDARIRMDSYPGGPNPIDSGGINYTVPIIRDPDQTFQEFLEHQRSVYEAVDSSAGGRVGGFWDLDIDDLDDNKE